MRGVGGKIDYEAQAAIELEMAAPDNVKDSEGESYPFTIIEEQGLRVVKLAGLISSVARMSGRGSGSGNISQIPPHRCSNNYPDVPDRYRRKRHQGSGVEWRRFSEPPAVKAGYLGAKERGLSGAYSLLGALQ